MFLIELANDVNGLNNELRDYMSSSTYVESIPAPHFN